MPLTPKILYEDNHLVAVFKPAGLLTQGDKSRDESLMDQVKNLIKERDEKPGKVFLGLLHRLDRNVSGIVLFAKTSKGASRLSEQFRDRTIEKTYTAVVEGDIASKSGTLRNYLCKDEALKVAIISDTPLPGYDEAALSYKTIRSTANYTVLVIGLETGRFHQIRAQFAHIGHPILGDTKYNSKTKLPDSSIALCATQLTFQTATGDERKTISIPEPETWKSYLK